MTKEKQEAERLVERFYDSKWSFREEDKALAIICCEEIITAIPSDQNELSNYWEKVILELRKM